MMTQRRRRQPPATPNRNVGRAASGASPKLRRELLAQIGAGVRSFEAGDRTSVASIEAFQHHVRALEWLAAAGLITIGARELAADASAKVVAINRIRLTEAGKRRTARPPSGPQDTA